MQGTFALSYLVQLALSRVSGFFVHWYGDGARAFKRSYRTASGSLESVVASRAMLHLMFRPLYGDYSVVGRIIGPIFRLGRLILGGVAHAAIAALFFVVWLIWASIPLLLITYATGIFSR